MFEAFKKMFATSNEEPLSPMVVTETVVLGIKEEDIQPVMDNLQDSLIENSAAIGEIESSIVNMSKVMEILAETAQESKEGHDLLAENVNAVKDKASSIKGSVDSIHEHANGVREKLESSSSSMDKALENIEMLVSKADALLAISKDVIAASTTIKEVYSQINILSLNANIEAARAGEAGRGFSVIAKEIRNLSNSTAESIKSIESVFESINQEVSDLSQGLLESHSIITESSDLTSESVTKFEEISDSIVTVQGSVSDLHRLARDSNALKDSNDYYMGELADNTQTAVATIQEIAANTEEQANLQAKTLNIIEKFNKDFLGKEVN